jgi:Nucleotidyl transferase AbiEii toxin, Type IV TA system
MNAGPLTPLQIQATRLFFSLPASAGFAVAGGAGLIARGLIARPTQDVDLFLLDARLSTVAAAASAFENALDRHGWSHSRVLDQKDFIRLSIADGRDSLIIDLGRDSPAAEPTGTTQLGPTLSPRDLAARKTLALFGRAEPRDFTDVQALALRYGRDRLLQWAAEDDPGFDPHVFAAMLATIDRLADADLLVSPLQATALRAWMHDWAAELQPHPARSPARTEAERDAAGQDPEHDSRRSSGVM